MNRNEKNALLQSEERFRHFFENEPAYCYIVSPKGVILDANKAALRVLGYKRKELVGQPLKKIYAPESGSLMKKLFEKWKKTGSLRNEELVIISNKGVKHTVLLSADTIKDENGKILHSISVQQDITERKKVEEALCRSEERYVLAQRAANIGSWDWDILTGDLEWSDRIEPIFGYASGEFGATYEAFLECLHPEDRQHVEDSVRASLEKDADYAIEHRIVWPDGTIHWVSETGGVFRDEKGRPIRMVGIVQDITERKRSEEKIAYLNNLLLSIKDIGQIISHESNLENLLEKVCILLLGTRNYIDISFSILDEKKRSLVQLTHRGVHRRKMGDTSLDGKDEAPDCIKTVMKTRSKLIINSTAEHCAECRYCTHHTDHQTVLIPMMYEKSLVGIMIVCLRAEHDFDEQEINLLEEIAEDLAFARAKIMAEGALRRSRDELELRVRERTTELVKANEALQVEMSERLLYQDKLRSLASELSLAEERERRRIATELHDRIVQTLAVSKIKASALREAAPSAGLVENIQDVIMLIDQAIQDTRTLTFELSPPILYELGFLHAVEWLAEKYEKQYNIIIKIVDDKSPKPLDADVRIVLFQTIRELFNNIVKHAHAGRVAIKIKKLKNYIRIIVEDDGVGFDVSKVSTSMESATGFGLFNIRERLTHLGGHFEIKSQKDRGTTLTLDAPLRHIEENRG